LGSAVAQEYFRVVIARFSKDIFRKEQKLLREKDKDSICNEILEYKRKVICKHFASDLARAVDEIIKEDNGIESLPHFPGSDVSSSNPALEFIKSVTTILDLDSEVQKEVQSLKRGLLAQIGVAEYSHAARWENPSAVFVLSDLFCHECHESRDVNLCEIPQLEGESAPRRHWCCDECGTHYDPELIEERLLATATKLALRYQMQDLRCPKTNRVSTKSLARHSDASTEFQLDISRNSTHSQFEMLHSIAKHHEFELLEEVTADILNKHVSAYMEHA
jgi:DNA polymerase epsilon subunit 1